jgi:hypothetical protein
MSDYDSILGNCGFRLSGVPSLGNSPEYLFLWSKEELIIRAFYGNSRSNLEEHVPPKNRHLSREALRNEVL